MISSTDVIYIMLFVVFYWNTTNQSIEMQQKAWININFVMNLRILCLLWKNRFQSIEIVHLIQKPFCQSAIYCKTSIAIDIKVSNNVEVQEECGDSTCEILLFYSEGCWILPVIIIFISICELNWFIYIIETLYA